jgi:hypothetical protein
MNWAVIFSSKIFWVISTAFWIWMIVDCIMNEPDRFLWLWIIFILNSLGAFIYFAVRKMPVLRYGSMPVFIRFSRAGEIAQAQANVHNIGNPHHFIKLGELYLETKNYGKADIAFKTALEKEPDDIQALWGSAQVDMKKKEYISALSKLEKVLKNDPDYKYGDASLMRARALFELKETLKAKEQLQKHLNKWSPPEARYMMASILADEGNKKEAYDMLSSALQEMKGAPAYYRAKNRTWMWAIRLLMAKVKN